MSPLPAPPEMPRDRDDGARNVRFEISLKNLLAVILVVALVWLLIRLWPVLLVLIVALLIAGTLSPAVHWLEAKRVKRGLGIGIVFASFVLVVLLVAFLTIPTLFTQVAALLHQEPALRARLADYLAGFHASAPIAIWLRGLPPDALSRALRESAFIISVRAFSAIAYGLSALFLGLYLMIDRDRLRGGLFALFPRAQHIRLARVTMNLEGIVGAYVRGQLITSALMALFTYVLLTACGVENALSLAVFAGLADVLPYVGPILSVGPAVFAALSQGPVVAAVVLVSMLVYEEFESRVLVPRMYGRTLRLPPSVVLFALLAGGTLMGIVGALLALPVAAAVMMLIKELRVELPGEQEKPAGERQHQADIRVEEEYKRRAAGVGAQQAAAIAAEISLHRREEEKDLS